LVYNLNHFRAATLDKLASVEIHPTGMIYDPNAPDSFPRSSVIKLATPRFHSFFKERHA
jgi:hypothetical protein